LRREDQMEVLVFTMRAEYALCAKFPIQMIGVTKFATTLKSRKAGRLWLIGKTLRTPEEQILMTVAVSNRQVQ
jgi:hypothetical protein